MRRSNSGKTQRRIKLAEAHAVAARRGHTEPLARNLYHPQLAELAAAVAESNGLPLQPSDRKNLPDESLQAWAERAGLSLRRVAFAENWWQHAEQAMLVCLSPMPQQIRRLADASGVAVAPQAQTTNRHQLLALLPDRHGQYVLHGLISDGLTSDGFTADGLARARLAPPRPLDAALASQLAPVAWRLHASLPARVLSLFDFLGVAWQLVGQDLVRLFLLSLAVTGTVWLAPFSLQALLQALLDGRQDWPGFAGLLCVSALGVAGLRAAMQIAVLRIDKRLAVGLQAALFERLLHLPLDFFQRHTAHQLAEKIATLDRLRRKSGQLAVDILSALALLFASLLYLVGNRSLHASGLLILPLLLLSLLMAMRTRRVEPRRQLAQSGASDAAQLLMHLLQNIGKLRLAGAQQAVFANWQRLLAAQPQNYPGIVLWQASLLCLEILLFGTLYWQVLEQFMLPEIAGLFLALLCWHGASRKLLHSLQTALQLQRQLLDIKPILQELPDGLSPTPAYPINDAQSGAQSASDANPHITGHLQIHHLAFAYPGVAQPILRDISLQLQAGQFVAIVGASGSGKTTLLRLLMGEYEATAGEIEFDAIPIKQFKLSALRSQFALVLQDAPYLAGSLFENIAANHPCSMAQAWLAAEKAGLAEEIRRMPLAMHTVLSDASAALSTGQIQRLLLARAVAKMLSGRASILLLDDALSALDSASQARIYAGLQGFTCILLTQRLASLRHLRQIFVLRDGCICEQGQAAELLAANAEFAKLAAGKCLPQAVSDQTTPKIPPE